MGALAAAAAFQQRGALTDITSIGLRSEEQSHVLLVPIIAAWLIWLRRARLDLVPPRPSLLGPLTMAFGWGMTWFGFAQGVQAAEHLGALITVVGAIFAFTGMAAVRQFWVVLPLLIFAVPVPGAIRTEIALPLQKMAATVTFETLTIFSVPVIQSGNLLTINGEQIAVAEACNGMRLVFALALVVYAFVFSVPLRTGPRIALLLLAPVIALVCNVIRLVPTALFFGYGSVEWATRFHDISGWVMLLVALAILWKCVRLMEWLELPVSRLRLANR
ncbi:MAG: exosortase/archaeosortase family protein [Phycisphaerales bacterium]